MTLTDVIPTLLSEITGNVTLSAYPIISAFDDSFDQTLETELLDSGIVILVSMDSGSVNTQNNAIIAIENQVRIGVVENIDTNVSGNNALAVTLEVMKTLHYALQANEKLRKTLVILGYDYDLLGVYEEYTVNLTVKSLDKIN